MTTVIMIETIVVPQQQGPRGDLWLSMKELICGSIERIFDVLASNAETLVVWPLIVLWLDICSSF
jgi:hypothetical protein